MDNPGEELREIIRQVVREELKKAMPQLVREELEAERKLGPEKAQCAWCGGEFPEDALDHSSGDPACAACQRTFNPKPPPNPLPKQLPKPLAKPLARR